MIALSSLLLGIRAFCFELMYCFDYIFAVSYHHQQFLNLNVKILGCIQSSTTREWILLLCLPLVKHHLERCIQLWGLQLKDRGLFKCLASSALS